MKEMKITDIQLFDYAEQVQIGENEFDILYSYSANVAINDEFMIQLSGNKGECNEDIPYSSLATWNGDAAQDYASENYDVQDIMNKLEIENNIGWLEDNVTDVMNPEDAQYRNA